MSDIFVDNIKHQSSQGSGTITLGASGEKVDLGATAGGTLTNRPAFAVRLSAHQTNLTDNNNVLVTFNTIEFDTDNAFDTSAGNYSFTVPSGKAGTYCLICNLHFNHSGQVNHNDTYIFKNGVALRGVRFNSSSGDYEDEGSEIITTIETLAVGDVINIYGRANSGDGTVTQLNGGTTQPASFFRGFRLIGV